MKLRDRPFQSIVKGEKRVELRLYDEKRRVIRVGDDIVFTHTQTGEKITVRVTGIKTFSDFAALYRAYDKVSIGYRADEIADPQDMLAYYSADEVAKYGVVAISFA